MYPLNSGGNREWFAGDNMFTGTPSNSGIYFEYDAYPVMNNGLNRFNLPSTTYFLNGQNPSELPEDFYVLQNYWGVTPQSSRFNISDATVHFSPFDSGYSAVRTADYNDLYEIGFGLYDSVSVKEDGDNSTIQDLYLLAYKKEYEKEYEKEFEDAIDLYKQIVSENENNLISASSLPRIFNCYDKSNANLSDYASLQTYFSNIQADTNNSSLVINIAEDFEIKCKAKQGLISEAVNDYEEIYNQNQNTPKGIHSLLNREILSSLVEDTTDNSVENGLKFDKIVTSQERVNSILKGIHRNQPGIFSSDIKSGYFLSQNYPNPFNPVTKISFDLPKRRKSKFICL